jgi:tetratricopeptide (TPR) repeat protein
LWRILAAFGMTSIVLLLAEAGLRLGGYGYPTAFFLADEVQDRPVFVNNPRYGWRFFPPALARESWPFALPAQKAPGACRIFVFGESAAMGDPDPRFGLPRMVEALLSQRFPEREFEVINTAFSAINSHVFLPIAREAARHQGDLWILYPGNNEVAGPFGPSTVFGSQSPPLPVIRANLALKTTRFGQWLESLLDQVGSQTSTPDKWLGMEMLLGNEIRSRDPRLDRVYAGYRKNLDDLVRAGRRASVPILLCTMATNLRDAAPFASLHRAGLSEADRAEWDLAYQAGVARQERGDFAGALVAFEQALRLDAEHADLHFRMAQSLHSLDRVQPAAEHYRRARDADALRFRADTRLNQIVHEVARAASGPYPRLFDAEAFLAQHSPNRLPGAEFFLDHVHLTPSGNYLLARGIADQVVDLLSLEPTRETGSSLTAKATIPARSNGSAASADWASEAQCRRWLGLTDRNLYSLYGRVLGRMQAPPFNQQLTHSAQVKKLADQQEALRHSVGRPQLEQMTEDLRQAVALRPNDGDLRSNYAALLTVTGDLAGAEREWRQVIHTLPRAVQAWVGLGMLLESQQRREEALSCYLESLRLSPMHPQASARLEALSRRTP